MEDTPPYFLNVQPVSRIREDVPVGSYLLQGNTGKIPNHLTILVICGGISYYE
jgi:hypothetical protein